MKLQYRNSKKQAYAEAYLIWLHAGKLGTEPDYHKFGLSFMGAQAVRLDLNSAQK